MVCSGPECDKPVRCKGVCTAHYRQLLKGVELKPLRGKRKPCSVDGCKQKSHARELCPKHYGRFLKHGSPDIVTKESTEELRYRMALGIKRCSECRVTKSADSFYKSAATRDGLTYFCKSCTSEKQKEWHARNREKNRQRSHIRRSRERAGSGVDLDALWEECDGFCPDCGGEIDRSASYGDPRFASVDHIIPLSRGGEHCQENVRFTCLRCNLVKNDKLLPDLITA